MGEHDWIGDDDVCNEMFSIALCEFLLLDGHWTQLTPNQESDDEDCLVNRDEWRLWYSRLRTADDDTVKSVYNDHLVGYFSAFWSSSRLAT